MQATIPTLSSLDTLVGQLEAYNTDTAEERVYGIDEDFEAEEELNFEH